MPRQMECQHCSELRTVFQISDLRELERAFKVISDNVADGTIAEDEARSRPEWKFSGYVPFSDMADSRSFDDTMIYFFSCLHCRQAFRLSLVTRGGGGDWQPIDD